MMNQKQNTPVYTLYKSKSYRASFSEALNLLFSNFKSFFIALFPTVIPIGLLVALFFVMSRVLPSAWYMIFCSLSVFVCAYFIAVLRQGFVTMMEEYAEKCVIKRISWTREFRKICVTSLTPFYMLTIQLLIIFSLLACSIFVFHGAVWSNIMVGVLIAVLLVPFNIGLNKLQFGGESFFKAFVHGFTAARRYFGSILMLLFFSFVLISLVFVLCFLPVFVLNLSISASDVAVFYGDPSDLPSYVYVLQFLLSLISISIVGFLSILWIVTQYFHFYSLKKKDAEREKAIRKMKRTRANYRDAQESYYLTSPIQQK